jgi:hypothetical protein
MTARRPGLMRRYGSQQLPADHRWRRGARPDPVRRLDEHHRPVRLALMADRAVCVRHLRQASHGSLALGLPSLSES